MGKKKVRSGVVDSDVLYWFLLRLDELEDREFYRRFRYTTHPGDIAPTEASEVTEESLIAYLAVLRQFILEREVCRLENVQRIIRKAATLQGFEDVLAQLEGLIKNWAEWSIGVTFVSHKAETAFAKDELLDLWLNHWYFHTRAERLHLFHAIPVAIFDASFLMMKVYAYELGRFASSHRPLVAKILYADVLKPGDFDLTGFRLSSKHIFKTPLRTDVRFRGRIKN
jgi:hypothetical protein